MGSLSEQTNLVFPIQFPRPGLSAGDFQLLALGLYLAMVLVLVKGKTVRKGEPESGVFASEVSGGAWCV